MYHIDCYVNADLELLGERLVIEKDPRVIILSIPLVFELSHTLYQPWQFQIPHQADQSGSRLSGVMTK